MTAQLRLGSRLHAGLLDLGEDVTMRQFGGFGFALATPGAVLTWESLPEGDLRLDVGSKIDLETEEAILDAIHRLEDKGGPLKGALTVAQVPRQHIGLGVTTALVIGALTLLNGAERLGLQDEVLQELSGRGGASGVGLHAQFDAGMIVDAGHRAGRVGPYLPSGTNEASSLPLKTLHVDCPRDWRVRILLPEGRRWSGAPEQEFFRANTPVAEEEVLESLALVYHGVVPAVMEDDLETLKNALFRLNGLGFKAREVASHGSHLRGMLDRLHETTPWACGMSSMGPMLYLIGTRDSIMNTEPLTRFHGAATDLGVHDFRRRRIAIRGKGGGR